jgi:hypothetical protein
LLQAVDHHPILDIGAVANVEGGSFIGADGSSRGDEHLSADAHIPDEIGKGVDVSRGMNGRLRQAT